MNTVWCPIKAKSNTIELTVHPSRYCVQTYCSERPACERSSGIFITVYDKRLESTDTQFGEILNNGSGSPTSFEYTRQNSLT